MEALIITVYTSFFLPFNSPTPTMKLFRGNKHDGQTEKDAKKETKGAKKRISRRHSTGMGSDGSIPTTSKAKTHMDDLIKEMDPDKAMKVLKKFVQEDSDDLVGKECMRAMKRAEHAKQMDFERSQATIGSVSPKKKNSSKTDTSTDPLLASNSPTKSAIDESPKSPTKSPVKDQGIEKGKGGETPATPPTTKISKKSKNFLRRTKSDAEAFSSKKFTKKKAKDVPDVLDVSMLAKEMDPDRAMKILKKFAEENSNDIVGQECLKAMKRAEHTKKADLEQSQGTLSPKNSPKKSASNSPKNSPKKSPMKRLFPKRKTRDTALPTVETQV